MITLRLGKDMYRALMEFVKYQGNIQLQLTLEKATTQKLKHNVRIPLDLCPGMIALFSCYVQSIEHQKGRTIGAIRNGVKLQIVRMRKVSQPCQEVDSLEVA